MRAFFFLLDLATFFDLFYENDLEAALEVAERLNVVPHGMSSSDSVEEVTGQLERLLENFKCLSEEVKQCFPQTLLCCMKIIFNSFTQVSPLVS